MTQPVERPHAPESSRLRRLLGPFQVTGAFWYRIHLWGASALPAWAFPGAIRIFTTVFWLFLRRIRRAVASNLAAVLGPCSWWTRQRRIYRTLHTFAWCLTERYERLVGRAAPEVEGIGLEHWRGRHADPSGFIVVTAHIGHWEVGSLLPQASEGRVVHIVREGEMDPRAQEIVLGLIRRMTTESLKVHFVDGRNAALGLELLAALRRGEVIALQGDRPRLGGRTVEVGLFGRPFPLPVGPLALARTVDVPVLPIFVYRTGRQRARTIIRPPISVPHSEDRAADLREAAQRLAADIEDAIAEAPHQWFCFRELWPSGPSAGDGTAH